MKEITSDNKKKIFFVLLTGICFVALITAVKRISFGLDNDEQYAVALVYRVARGDILIREMWEPHQFSVLIFALPVKLFLLITKSTDCLLIFLRIIGVLIQAFTSFLMYRFLREKCDNLTSLFSAALIFFCLPKFIQSPEFANMQIWLLIILLISFFRLMEKESKPAFYLIPGILFLLEVLDYPSCVLLMGLFAVLMWKRCKKGLIFFVLPSILFAAGFAFYVLINIGLPDFFMYVREIVSDGSHSAGMLQNVIMYLSELPHMFLFTALYTAAACVIVLTFCLISKNKIASKRFVIDTLMLATVISFVDQIRFWIAERTPLVYPQYRFVLLFVLGIVVYCLSDEEFRMKWKKPFKLFYIANTVTFFMVMLLTNLALKSIFGYLLPACVLSLAVSLDYFSKNNERKRPKTGFALLSTGVLIVSIFSQLWLISINNEGNYEDIRLVRQKSLNGASKYVYREWLDGYRANSDYDLINASIPSGSRIFLYGKSSLTYLSGDYEICTPSTISTPSFDKKTMDYFEFNPRKMPQYIIHEKWIDGKLRNVSDDYIEWYNDVISQKVAESDYIEIYTVKNY